MMLSCDSLKSILMAIKKGWVFFIWRFHLRLMSDKDRIVNGSLLIADRNLSDLGIQMPEYRIKVDYCPYFIFKICTPRYDKLHMRNSSKTF